MELYEQYASYPVEDWLSDRTSQQINWETLFPDAADQTMMANCGLISAHSFLGENPISDDYHIGYEGFLPPPLDQDQLNRIDGCCPVEDQFQAVIDNASYSGQYDTPSSNFQQVHEDNNINYTIWSTMEDVLGDDFEGTMEIMRACKMEPLSSVEHAPVPSGRTRGGRANKRAEGQPSKNLMAERRRRKRLNERLSMLRSIVPKISKMDRTSILGDTIDYMKELMQKIDKLKDEIQLGSPNQLLEDMKPNDLLFRNSPKFNVERRNAGEVRVEMCCTGKPGLLLSTVNTLEALGLDIQHCVISCFNEFGLQACCSEKAGKRAMASPEDIKQALFKNAGYGGRCL
ncbi:hypothetical protein SAY86_029255 [Trapa natans]|uniref:BHLH domain-containing protein n=1 Tax=Trapa natans TaxID=22666 RepID=A0AAN7M1W1_TRANT|nr:hypothetical protein SAY86_029255 [Trapa natans]